MHALTHTPGHAKGPHLLTPLATWSISALGIAGLVLRPFGHREWVWPTLAAVVLVSTGLVSWPEAWHAVGRGVDVCLFIAGMMLLAELARREALFDYLAAHAVAVCRGSPQRLFLLVYAIGTIVTVFMSNDATAVVLTPAVAAAARAARIRALPYLFACALVANAASFVLPLSNPANLLIFDGQMPALAEWLRRLGPSAAASVLATYAVLRWAVHDDLRVQRPAKVEVPHLSFTGRCAAVGVLATAAALIAASALGADLGWVAFAAAGIAVGVVLAIGRRAPLPLVRDVDWSVLVLVAALFVLVQAVEGTQLLAALTHALDGADASSREARWLAGVLSALGCNVLNNLPAGLVAASTLSALHAPGPLRDAVAIGIDLGPNLSITGALSNVLWLVAIRREGEEVGALAFLRLGLVAMPVALAGALLLL